MKHQKLFEQLAARTLATAADAFPMPKDFWACDILEAEGLDLSEANYEVAESTLEWLHDENFLRALGKGRGYDRTGVSHLEFRKSRLTVVGLDALNRTLDVSGETAGQKAGDLLVDQLKQSAGEARSAVISEVIGTIIGSAAKVFLRPDG